MPDTVSTAPVDTEQEQQKKPKKKRRRRKKERDFLAPKPGRKPGSTQLHKTLKPEHLEEVHARLIWDTLEGTRAYIAQVGYVDQEGEPLISINQLKYYRGRYITPEERIGHENVGRFLQEFRIRLDSIALQEALIAAQTMRLQWDLKLEKDAKETTMAATGSNLDLLHQLNRTLYKMKQEAGLIPQPLPPLQRHHIEADVSQVSAQVQQQVSEDIPPSHVKETLSKFKEYLMDKAVKAEGEKMKGKEKDAS